jgi:F0F1-type ATP synthase delta subunit
MYSEILERLTTRTELETLQEEIVVLKNSFYKTKKDSFEETLAKSVRAWVSNAILKDLQEAGIERKAYLKGLEEQLKKLRIVQIALPFEPTRENIITFKTWMNANLDSLIVLDIAYHPSIIAGANIAFEGKYKDYSIQSKLNETLNEAIQKKLS